MTVTREDVERGVADYIAAGGQVKVLPIKEGEIPTKGELIRRMREEDRRRKYAA